ncbi:MAG: Gldg family protein [Alphaproteobacteria bacterium]|nr:Gldg family protein [Alphaproteobacteria bacterium]
MKKNTMKKNAPKNMTTTTIDIDKLVKNISLVAIGAFIVFLLMNLIGTQLSGVRLDLTQGRLYSLSPVTKGIIDELEQDITIDFYVSDELLTFAPNYIPFTERLTTLLEGMQNRSDNIRFNKITVEAFSEAEDKALGVGMSDVPLNANGDKVYFGLHLQTGSGEQLRDKSIPFLQLERETFMEYDIVKLLTELRYETFPKVGLISDADPMGFSLSTRQASRGWASVQQLQQFYQLEQLFSAKDIFEFEPDMLLIAHGAVLDTPMLWGIEQYLMRGGRALIYVDPVFESLAPNLSPNVQGELNSTKALNPMFNKWGVHVSDDSVIIDPEYGIPVNMARNETEVIPIIHSSWLRYNTENISANDLVTSDIETLNIISAGEIEVKEAGKVQIDALIESSPNSQRVDKNLVAGPTADLEKILSEFNPENGKKRMIAARIIGSFETIFPDGRAVYEDPTEEEKTFDWPKSLKKSEKPFEVILVSDVDLLQDRFWAQLSEIAGQSFILPFSGNGLMLENAVENLSGLPTLGELRSRGTRLRPFILLDAIRQEAETNYRVRANELSRKSQELQQHIDNLKNSYEDNVEEEQGNQQQLQEKVDELLETRQELRDVQRDLRSDLESVNQRITILNIAVMPIMVIIIGVLVFRRRRKKQRA